MQIRQSITVFQSCCTFLLLHSKPETRTQLEFWMGFWCCHRPQLNLSWVTWTSSLAGRVGSNIPSAWAWVTASFACWKASCLILPQSRIWPFFVGGYKGLIRCAKRGIKEHQYPSISRNSYSCSGVAGTENARTLSITTLGNTLVLPGQTSPRNFKDRPTEAAMATAHYN